MRRNFFPVDVFLFLVFAAVFIRSSLHVMLLASLVVMLVGGYLAAHIFLSARYAVPIKLVLVWLLITVAGISPAVGNIIWRHRTEPVLFVHDGVIQTEEAIKFLLEGKNPYAENYLNTPMARWLYDPPGTSINPALYHLAYWPFLFLFSTPFYLAAQVTLGWFDERMLYLPMFVVMLMLLSHLARAREKQLALVLLVGLNPLFLPYFIEGRNDVFVLFWLVISFVFIEHQHRVMSLITLAFACATKPTVWFIIPFYVLYLLGRERFSQSRRLVALLGVFVAVMAAVVLPFILWNPYAFFDDVWNYTAGTATFSYPISTFGFGAIALSLGWIQDKMTPFPFGILQLVFGLPTLFLLCRYQLAHNNSRSVWLCYAFLTLVVSFFSRVFNDNHVGFVISLFAIGLMIGEEPAVDQTPPAVVINT